MAICKNSFDVSKYWQWMWNGLSSIGFGILRFKAPPENKALQIDAKIKFICLSPPSPRADSRCYLRSRVVQLDGNSKRRVVPSHTQIVRHEMREINFYQAYSRQSFLLWSTTKCQFVISLRLFFHQIDFSLPLIIYQTGKCLHIHINLKSEIAAQKRGGGETVYKKRGFSSLLVEIKPLSR